LALSLTGGVAVRTIFVGGLRVTYSKLRRYSRQIKHHLLILRHIRRVKRHSAPFTLKSIIVQKLGRHRHVYWPVHFTSVVQCPERIRVGIDSAPGLAPGCYIQANNGIEIGDYRLIAPNVGLISADHSPFNIKSHESVIPIRIGNYCWVGMNAVVLPSVQLGDHTIVGAGAIVTKSFPDGYCVIAGNPARLIKRLDPLYVVEQKNEHEYVGFYPLEGRTKQELYNYLGIRSHLER
jgi:acetyltransferase-like isoleucine patch superfamily enzyme